MELHFTGGGAIEGARIEQYLLEKSRIVTHGPSERNYHIFYCLLAGLSVEEKEKLFLADPIHYYYLNQVCVSNLYEFCSGFWKRGHFATLREGKKARGIFIDEWVNRLVPLFGGAEMIETTTVSSVLFLLA